MIRRKIWGDLPVFAQTQTSSDGRAIANLRGWRLREPFSGRRYTVLRLETRDGLAGYGEGGPVSVADIVDARTAVTGRRPTESEFIRHRLAACPAMETAVN